MINLAILQEALFDGSVNEVVPNLIRNDRVSGQRPLRLLELGHRKIADTDKPYFPRIHEACQRLHGLLDRNCGIGLMKLQKVNRAYA
jgi:hypothetical protein